MDPFGDGIPPEVKSEVRTGPGRKRRAHTVKLDPKERKLLLLAFDPGATPDESLAALRFLFRNWLTKYPDGHALVQDLESTKIETKERIVYRDLGSPYGDVTLGFGKYKGNRLRDVPVDYLLWILDNFGDLWPSTREAIEKYLDS